MKPSNLQVLKYLCSKTTRAVGWFLLLLTVCVLCFPLGLNMGKKDKTPLGEPEVEDVDAITMLIGFLVIVFLGSFALWAGSPYWFLYPMISAGIGFSYVLLVRLFHGCRSYITASWKKAEQEVVESNSTEPKDILLRATDPPNTLCIPAEEPRHIRGRA